MSRLLEQGVPFRSAEAEADGLSQRALRRMVADGRLLTLGQGIYLPADSDRDADLAEITMRAPDATLCLISALAHHDLIDDIPVRHDMAIPRGAHRPRAQAFVHWHNFERSTFSIGREQTLIRGVDTYVYSAERSIADAFRMRGYIGYEAANIALKAWLQLRGNTPAQLMATAEQLPRAEGPLRAALEVLL